MMASMLVSMAQITTPAVEVKPDTDPKYLEGAVPVVDGLVVFTRTVSLPKDISHKEVMTKMEAWLDRCMKDDRIHESVRLPDSNSNQLQQTCTMEVTFSKSFLSHDFTEMTYVLSLTAEKNQIVIEMSHIYYRYRTGDKMEKYKAEEWITDEVALNKKHTKMIYGFKKFRMKTIDMVDEFQASLQKEFN